MAEGLIGGVLGEEEEKPEAEAAVAAAPAPVSAEAFASAVAARLSQNDPEVARDTSAFLKKQTQLLDTQHRILEDEHALRLAHLHNQHAEENIRRLGLRLRVGFQLFLALVATVIGIGFLMMVRSAMTASGVVIDEFQVPAELTQRGLSGQVVARQLLDKLSYIQSTASAGTARPASSYASNWGSELKVEVPETGISFGELSRYLRETLGHEQHISGEIHGTAAALTVTVRDGDETGHSFTGKIEEIDRLVLRSAEVIYEQTQPYRYAIYLNNDPSSGGRWSEVRGLLEKLLLDPRPIERAWAQVGISATNLMSDHDMAGYASHSRAALADVPQLTRAIGNVVAAEVSLGHYESARQYANQCLVALRDNPESTAPAWREFEAARCLQFKNQAEGDYDAMSRAALSLPAQSRQSSVYFVGSGAVSQLLTHDLDSALAFDWDGRLAGMIDYPSVRSLVLGRRDYIAGRAALERGDPHAVEYWKSAVANDDQPATSASHDFMSRNSAPWLAYSKARFGDLPGGQALIAETPLDCGHCVQIRGRIAALAGDTAGAERWFKQAIALAPKLPQAYVDRGQARLDRGDLSGALADATQAAMFSPHHADAFKLWGDVLAKQGRAKEALAQYDAAFKYAPKWEALKVARETSAAKEIRQ